MTSNMTPTSVTRVLTSNKTSETKHDFHTDKPWILPTFSHGEELHRCIRCLAMDGALTTVRLSPYFITRYIFELAFQCRQSEINQHPVAEVMSVLLMSGQSASREEAVEKRNIDAELLKSINMDARMRAKHIL
ncbi:hypothetical protein F2Q69_00049650 [Brassica cretica]|uniref:Uncharacterized protein n=1 Tax=Brassica cretica TaxID=69181 RepID=A0A8S9PPE7_BRACR|nr:hypothetical protein F2Q69_00049650 [Brassica cretica]